MGGGEHCPGPLYRGVSVLPGGPYLHVSLCCALCRFEGPWGPFVMEPWVRVCGVLGEGTGRGVRESWAFGGDVRCGGASVYRGVLSPDR